MLRYVSTIQGKFNHAFGPIKIFLLLLQPVLNTSPNSSQTHLFIQRLCHKAVEDYCFQKQSLMPSQRELKVIKNKYLKKTKSFYFSTQAKQSGKYITFLLNNRFYSGKIYGKNKGKDVLLPFCFSQ